MENPSTSTVYINVIEDVINKSRGRFVRNGGPGEAILNELQIGWEKRMMIAGFIVGPIDRSAARLMPPRDPEYITGDLNLPYGGPEMYETPGDDLHFPQGFLQLSCGKRKRDDLFSPHGPSGYIPQQDGAGDDVMADEFEAGQGSNPQLDTITIDDELESSSPKIPQLDGTVHDNTNTGAVNVDLNVANASGPLELEAPTPAAVNPNDDDEDESLNENDDDDDDDDLTGVDRDEIDVRYLILTMFDKVTRVKSRWRCSLRSGIAHIGGGDLLFKKALGEFEFDF